MTPEATSMKISIGGDHAGFPLKATVIAVCKDLGHEVTDHGCHDETPVDFPDITRQVCADVLNGKAERAILVCGTGVGASIAANKVRGIRAAVLHDWHCAHQAVEHDDVNVMCIGAQIVGLWLARDLVDAYLAATFSDDPDLRRRVAKLHAMEAP
jgi:ribose 5-phosphate isomerase B